MEHADKPFYLRVGKTVEDRLCLMARRNQLLLAQLGQVLGQRRLAEAGGFYERAGSMFACQ